eukprot:TRINITY_DN1230_c0_g1_i1.p1 TRINITY_DN1230_c0_g1~~TRINITY_DN1230_c0_g1_i1.p1  ORF type:complete len:343 (+),score=160.41 TRINITY_DN1230_c0_g1_i1:71-1099(+)
MSFKYDLYSHDNQGAFSSTKIQIAAKYAGLALNNKKASEVPYALISKYAISKSSSFDFSFPILIETDDKGSAGPIWGSFAIARHVARSAEDDVSSQLLGESLYQQGQIDQWIDFAANEMLVPINAWLYPKYGFFQTSSAEEKISRDDVISNLAKLDKHLVNNTFFATERVSLADIIVFSTILPLFIHVLGTKDVKNTPNLLRWFKTCSVQDQFKQVIGKPKFKAYEYIDALGSPSTSRSLTGSNERSRGLTGSSDPSRQELLDKFNVAKAAVAHATPTLKTEIDKAVEIASCPVVYKKLTEKDIESKAIPSIYNPPAPSNDKASRNHNTSVHVMKNVQQPQK